MGLLLRKPMDTGAIAGTETVGIRPGGKAPDYFSGKAGHVFERLLREEIVRAAWRVGRFRAGSSDCRQKNRHARAAMLAVARSASLVFRAVNLEGCHAMAAAELPEIPEIARFTGRES